MIESKAIGTKIFKIFLYIILGALAISCIYPIWYAFCLSTSSKTAANSGMVNLYPVDFTLRSYKEIMGDLKFLNSFWISIQRSVIGTVVSLLIMILMGYPLSKTKREFKPRNVLMWLVIFCMVFNSGAIPWYITMVNYGLLDSMIGLVLCGGLPVFNLILIMNFFRNLPRDLEEAAVVDGAGPWRILFGIVVPCSVPVLATIVLFTSVGYWNEFFQGLVLSSSDKNYPLQTYIKQMVVNVQTAGLTTDQLKIMNELSNKSLDSAKVFIAMIPMLVVYPFLQKYFVSGIMLGAVKE
ncbi:MAG: carbohydrate ABC transporter permease [Clostridiales bacterium]|jgi:multiple sugar transport system permease protein/putative aldouronate transport system permease protein|nr:carbohydrate ABC transporter permease [Clostridiales bacterium]